MEHLRCHVSVSTFAGQVDISLFHHPRDAKITQLIVSAWRYEYIFRFYVPVKYVVLSAELQGTADVDTEQEHILLFEGMIYGMLDQRSQKLCLDQNIPAQLLLIFYDLMIFVIDDVAVAFELGQILELTGYVADQVSVIIRKIFSGNSA